MCFIAFSRGVQGFRITAPSQKNLRSLANGQAHTMVLVIFNYKKIMLLSPLFLLPPFVGEDG
jgi:hypothetical protein